MFEGFEACFPPEWTVPIDRVRYSDPDKDSLGEPIPGTGTRDKARLGMGFVDYGGKDNELEAPGEAGVKVDIRVLLPGVHATEEVDVRSSDILVIGDTPFSIVGTPEFWPLGMCLYAVRRQDSWQSLPLNAAE